MEYDLDSISEKRQLQRIDFSEFSLKIKDLKAQIRDFNIKASKPVLRIADFAEIQAVLGLP